MFYFRHVNLKYGELARNYCSKWVRGVKRILVLKEQLTFLLRCRKSRVFPKHIESKFNNEYFHRCYNRRVSYDVEKSVFFFKSKLVSFEIKDLNFEIDQLNKYLLGLEAFLFRTLNYNDLQLLCHNQERHFNKVKYEKRKKLKRKFELLIREKHSRVNHDVDNKRWFRNLTDRVIPDEVVNVMSRGSRFGVPYSNRNLPVKELIAGVESGISRFSDDFKGECRNSVVEVLRNFKKENKFDNFVHANLYHDLKMTRIFLRENPDIVFQKADKGNVTVASLKVDYISHIKLLLDDDTTYMKIGKPHINRLQENLKRLLSGWMRSGYIDIKTFKYLRCENGTVAKCYGLPKIHKERLTYRIIISSVNFPTYKLAKFLSDILINVVGKTNSYVKDSWSFYDMARDIVVPNDHVMISLDVVSLFTNIPLELVSDIITEKWLVIGSFTQLTKDEFIKALQLVFNNTVFSFDKIFYEQRYGCPMGSPLSPVIANLVMEKLEGMALSRLNFEPIIFKRYVDDIFTIVPKCFVDEMVDVFNSIHDRIKFTIELEVENRLNFLDIEIIREMNNKVKLNWYRKPTWSGRFLNFESHHQFGNKVGTLKGVIDRAIKLSHGDFRKDNLKLVRTTFINNNYPIEFVDRMIDERVNEIYNSDLKNNKRDTDFENNEYFVLPYVRGLSERIRRVFKKHNIQIFFKNNNNLGRFFNNCKDKDERDDKSGIVYKINCNDCDKYYIGQTSRYLKKRIYEHKYSLRNPNIMSGLKQHGLDLAHSFDFDNVEILEQGIRNKFKRESLENIHIFKNKKNVNLMLESSKLDCAYHPFLT